MKYYLIAGEASGDLHASHLITALKRRDAEAEFRCIGGDLMEQAGGELVRHYRELAYMGIGPVLHHLPAILRNMRMVKRDIREWMPDAVILVDYPGFNLEVAKYIYTSIKSPNTRQQNNRATGHKDIKVFYYIAPKIWAWKEWRIKSIRRYVDELLSILPFEVDFFEGKHHFPVHYVGNPTADEVGRFLAKAHIGNDDFLRHNILSETRPIIAVLCGSRKQEIEGNLPAMLEATDGLGDYYQVVVAGAPGIDHDFYKQFTHGHHATVLHAGQTYQLLYNAHAALVTSGTATLETALFGVPQVVCYATPMPRFVGQLRKIILKVKYVSLVNLIAGREVVPELVAEKFSANNISSHLNSILEGAKRKAMLSGYEEVKQRLGSDCAPDNAASVISGILATATRNR